MQVWLGRAIPDPTHLAAAAERDLLLPPQLPPAAQGLPASGLLAPGRRCTVAYILDDATCSSSNGPASSGILGAVSGGGGAPAARLAASFEEQQRQECAERLCRAVALFYRVDAEDAGIAGGGIFCLVWMACMVCVLCVLWSRDAKQWLAGRFPACLQYCLHICRHRASFPRHASLRLTILLSCSPCLLASP